MPRHRLNLEGPVEGTDYAGVRPVGSDKQSKAILWEFKCNKGHTFVRRASLAATGAVKRCPVCTRPAEPGEAQVKRTEWCWRRASAEELSDKNSIDELQLVSPDGVHRASVWPNGAWCTMDTTGKNGDCGVELSVREACEQAVLALHRQSFTEDGFRSPMPRMPPMPTEVPAPPPDGTVSE